MSDDNDDLHGRQLLILLAFFSSLGGVLLLIAWITRPNWLWDAPLAAFAAAGIACYPARFLVERFDWWKRLEQPTERTKARQQRAHVDARAGSSPLGWPAAWWASLVRALPGRPQCRRAACPLDPAVGLRARSRRVLRAGRIQSRTGVRAGTCRVGCRRCLGRGNRCVDCLGDVAAGVAGR